MCYEKGFYLEGSHKKFQFREALQACNLIKQKGEFSTEQMVLKIQAQMLTQDVKNPELLKKVLKQLRVEQKS